MTSCLRTMSLVALFSFHALAEAASGSSTSSTNTFVKSASLATTSPASTQNPSTPAPSFSFDKILPSVVQIIVQAPPSKRTEKEQALLDYLNQQPSGKSKPKTEQERTYSNFSGSGFYIAENYLLTNAHVVAKAELITIFTKDERHAHVKLVGVDAQTDLAVLKIEDPSFYAPSLAVAPGNKTRIGDRVFAVGSPFGLDFSVSSGIVSSPTRYLPSENYLPFIQADVAVNPGNSGGPLLNDQGQVIGVTNQIYSNSGGFMGLSFSIPIDQALTIARAIIKNQSSVKHGFLNILAQNINPDMALSFNLPGLRGMALLEVGADSPAFQGGLRTGDLITKINQTSLTSMEHFFQITLLSQPKEVLELQGFRFNDKTGQLQPHQWTVTMGEHPQDKASSPYVSPSSIPLNTPWGMSLSPTTVGKKKDPFLVVTRVDPGLASEAQFMVGDLIISYNFQQIYQMDDFQTALKKQDPKKPATFLVFRPSQRERIFLTVTP